MIVTTSELHTICKHAEEDYPSECCGVVMTRGSDRELLRLRNMQDEMNRLDPERFPRTAQTAYYVGLQDHRRIEELSGRGFVIEVIYHSHPNAGAYFSKMDRERAALSPTDSDGRYQARKRAPLWPGVTYVVVSVNEGRATEIAAFRWYPVLKDFAEFWRRVLCNLEPSKDE